MAIRIFANHAHVFPAAIKADGTIDRLLGLMDACDIEQAVCFAPFPNQVKETGLDQNKWLAGELALPTRRGRLHGFGTVDLKRNDLKEQVQQITDLGLRGIKMHPNAQEFDILCPEALEVYAAAQDRKRFITFHSGIHHYRIDHYNVLKFDEVAYRFPDLRFSLEHVGGYAFFNQALAVISNNIPFPPVPGRKGTVFGGLTSIFTPHYNRLWYMSRERLLELLAQVGAEQLIFGLDFPYNLEENTKMGLKALGELGLSEEQKERILGGNLRDALAGVNGQS
jgi:predicted TIM-barrel fold metal-dependent hydrolase